MPLWKNQLAQAVTIFRMSDAAEVVKKASDLTNDLLEKNAETLRSAMPKPANKWNAAYSTLNRTKSQPSLIDTINDSLRIADEGKAMRAKAEEEIKVMEGELREPSLLPKPKLTARVKEHNHGTLG